MGQDCNTITGEDVNECERIRDKNDFELELCWEIPSREEETFLDDWNACWVV